MTLDSYELEQVIDRGMEAFDWSQRKPANSDAGPKNAAWALR